MSEAGDNLFLLLSAWIELARTGKPDELIAILHPKVRWQGILPGQICHNRQEVMHVMAGNFRRPMRLTRLDAQEAGDRVVISAESDEFPEVEGQAAGAPRHLRFTFKAGKVVMIETLGSRQSAFEHA